MTSPLQPHPRPLRSVLYVPGSNHRAVEKARTLPCDAVILDLEDAVAPEAKIEARDTVASALKAGGFGSRFVAVRFNRPEGDWGREDLKTLAPLSPDAVLLPKVETPDEIHSAARDLFNAGASDRTVLWAMMETPWGILNASAIAASHKRLHGFVMGTSDLTRELHAVHRPDRLPLLFSLGQCLLAARAHGLSILDGVHLDLNDEAGFAAACQQAADMGFDGKTLIHPKTIAAANQAFSPSPAMLEQARKTVEAWKVARSEGRGLVVLDGRLVEELHVREAERLLALEKLIREKSAA